MARLSKLPVIAAPSAFPLSCAGLEAQGRPAVGTLHYLVAIKPAAAIGLIIALLRAEAVFKTRTKVYGEYGDNQCYDQILHNYLLNGGILSRFTRSSRRAHNPRALRCSAGNGDISEPAVPSFDEPAAYVAPGHGRTSLEKQITLMTAYHHGVSVTLASGFHRRCLPDVGYAVYFVGRSIFPDKACGNHFTVFVKCCIDLDVYFEIICAFHIKRLDYYRRRVCLRRKNQPD